MADTLHAGRRLKTMFVRLPQHEERFPHLLDIIGGIENVRRLETALEQSIGPRGDVLDTASSELARLRKAVRIAHSRVTERLRNLQSSGRVGAAMQENIITVREGRYVIPGSPMTDEGASEGSFFETDVEVPDDPSIPKA